MTHIGSDAAAATTCHSKYWHSVDRQGLNKPTFSPFLPAARWKETNYLDLITLLKFWALPQISIKTKGSICLLDWCTQSQSGCPASLNDISRAAVTIAMSRITDAGYTLRHLNKQDNSQHVTINIHMQMENWFSWLVMYTQGGFTDQWNDGTGKQVKAVDYNRWFRSAVCMYLKNKRCSEKSIKENLNLTFIFCACIIIHLLTNSLEPLDIKGMIVYHFCWKRSKSKQLVCW